MVYLIVPSYNAALNSTSSDVETITTFHKYFGEYQSILDSYDAGDDASDAGDYSSDAGDDASSGSADASDGSADGCNPNEAAAGSADATNGSADDEAKSKAKVNGSADASNDSADGCNPNEAAAPSLEAMSTYSGSDNNSTYFAEEVVFQRNWSLFVHEVGKSCRLELTRQMKTQLSRSLSPELIPRILEMVRNICQSSKAAREDVRAIQTDAVCANACTDVVTRMPTHTHMPSC